MFGQNLQIEVEFESLGLAFVGANEVVDATRIAAEGTTFTPSFGAPP
jgi:hypothetical protein